MRTLRITYKLQIVVSQNRGPPPISNFDIFDHQYWTIHCSGFPISRKHQMVQCFQLIVRLLCFCSRGLLGMSFFCICYCKCCWGRVWGCGGLQEYHVYFNWVDWCCCLLLQTSCFFGLEVGIRRVTQDSTVDFAHLIAFFHTPAFNHHQMDTLPSMELFLGLTNATPGYRTWLITL